MTNTFLFGFLYFSLISVCLAIKIRTMRDKELRKLLREATIRSNERKNRE